EAADIPGLPGAAGVRIDRGLGDGHECTYIPGSVASCGDCDGDAFDRLRRIFERIAGVLAHEDHRTTRDYEPAVRKPCDESKIAGNRRGIWEEHGVDRVPAPVRGPLDQVASRDREHVGPGHGHRGERDLGILGRRLLLRPRASVVVEDRPEGAYRPAL